VSDVPYRNLSIRKMSIAVTVIAVIAGVVLAVWGIVDAAREGYAVSGAVLLCSGIILIVVALLASAGVQLILKAEANISRLHHDALDLIETLHRLEPMLRTMRDNSEISDVAKSIAHREKEGEALRHAIREEMYAGNWEAAVYLIDEMERRFGYKQESEALRHEMSQVREMTIEEKIGDAVARIEKHIDGLLWDRARVEIERLLKLFPRHERIQKLPALLNQRREQQKQKLLIEWNAAVDREEIDRAVEILTQLDEYLSRAEAQSLHDSARHVFKARLLNLGVKFAMAVQEQRWRDALEVGLQIRDEFPNSRMAREVDAKIETLRVRAGFVPEAEMSRGQGGETPA
jgi:hypothetical protein